MIASDRRQRWMLGAAAISGMLSLAGCGDFAHTNPLDRQTPVTVEISGPDSAFSFLDTVSFVAHTLPSYSPESVVWTSVPSGLLVPIGNGSFQIPRFAQNGTVTVRVEADGRIGQHLLTFVHRTTSVHVEECGTHSRTPTLDALDRIVSLCLAGFDARGYPSVLQEPTLSVSDTAILAVSTAYRPEVSARANGTAVVRLSMGEISDSMAVTVRQRIVSVWLAPAQCRSMGIPLTIGDSLQVSATSVGFDATNHLVRDTTRVRAAVRGMTFSLGDVNYGGVKVSPSGMVTALLSLWANVFGTATTPEEGTVSGVCYFMPEGRR